ncbi:MAG: type II CRISPR-associated endonuclease Cas1 [Alphaproteobacteria bacterium]|nr:type II CRISPR-associated endonuclease Cas1 [Alphaproteobacteria bacterium]
MSKKDFNMLSIIEISSDNRAVHVSRGFLQIKSDGAVLSEVPLDSIGAIMTTGNAIVWTNDALSRLCEEGVPVIIIGPNYHPNGIMLSLVGQYKQTEIQRQQINISKPLQKQLWASVVKEKVKNQSRVLDTLGINNPIKSLSDKVQSGDTGGIEARAARAYFPALFGKDFLRRHTAPGINSFLNYGYAIIRATLARQVVAAGLNPSFGIQHHNALNPFCLVDDLIEPYRPIVDLEVYNIFRGKDDTTKTLTPEYKKILTGIIYKELKNNIGGTSPLYTIMQRDVWAFANSIKEKQNLLEYTQTMIDNDEHTHPRT